MKTVGLKPSLTDTEASAASLGRGMTVPLIYFAVPASPERVIDELEEAGATLLSLSDANWPDKLRTGPLEVVRTALEHHRWSAVRPRLVEPTVTQLARMEEVLNWISLIPLDRYVLRRVVGARCLVHPVTGRHLYSWRGLGTALGADHRAIQRRHALGIGIITKALTGG
jgi:hypothetical protein